MGHPLCVETLGMPRKRAPDVARQPAVRSFPRSSFSGTMVREVFTDPQGLGIFLDLLGGHSRGIGGLHCVLRGHQAGLGLNASLLRPSPERDEEKRFLEQKR